MKFFEKFDWRIFHGGMIVFYLLGVLAFLFIGNLEKSLIRILFGLLVLLVIKEIVRFVLRLRKECKITDEVLNKKEEK
ncbi:putative lipid-binding transport protein (Tim44 family) [Natronobacillus azotifigens]|uniref:Uncharacterized protein n=1 Tax=Natronobacillus azotifigens TaxID=472978 RepID=A0A9J6R8U9_9BACI|nr:hypothetical protein [Natronobacillus azotifigens]MCZ0701676.1 hypothetical protein [Natronobacillus azotifigens]